MKNKSILIIGGTGFLGFHLCNFFKKKKWSVFSLSQSPPTKYRKANKIKYLFGDISKIKRINFLSKLNIDHIVNCGGYVDHYNKVETYNTHVKGCKNLYKIFNTQDTFSDRLLFFLLHFAFFLKNFKNDDKKILQEIYDCMFKQLELSIREIGYGDASINKKMKNYINLFHTIINKLENWDKLNSYEKNKIINSLLNIEKNDYLSVYFDKYSIELKNNTLNYYIKSVIKPKK